jgi:hypothetical protein
MGVKRVLSFYGKDRESGSEQEYLDVKERGLH